MKHAIALAVFLLVVAGACAEGAKHGASTTSEGVSASLTDENADSTVHTSDVTAKDMENALRRRIPGLGSHSLKVKCEDIGPLPQGLGEDTVFACSYVSNFGLDYDRCFQWLSGPLEVTRDVATYAPGVTCESYVPPILRGSSCGQTTVASSLFVQDGDCNRARALASAYVGKCFTESGACIIDANGYHAFCDSTYDGQRDYVRVDCLGEGARVFFQLGGREERPSTVLSKSDFLSPSGNIACSLGPTAFCQTTDPMQSVTLRGDGKSEVCRGLGCVGDAPENAFELGYGKSVAHGPFYCTSSEDGVTCVVTGSGSGFTISRTGIERF
jgi:hypothetical protein